MLHILNNSNAKEKLFASFIFRNFPEKLFFSFDPKYPRKTKEIPNEKNS